MVWFLFGQVVLGGRFGAYIAGHLEDLFHGRNALLDLVESVGSQA